VYADDTVQVIMQALQDPSVEGRVFNLNAPSPPTWNEYFDRYAKALHVRLQKVPSSALALETKVLAVPLKVTQLLAGQVGLQTPDPMPGSLLKLFKQKIVLRSVTIDQVMHPRWTPLDEGLARTAAWYDYQRAPTPVGREARPGGRPLPGGSSKGL